jgi:hypothetical protein
MRVFVFLLIVANLLFFAWSQGYFGTPTNPDAQRVGQQLLPEQIRVVARDEPPPAGDSNGNASNGANRTEPVAPGKVSEPAGTVSAESALAEVADSPAVQDEVAVCLRSSEVTVPVAEKIESLLAERFSAFRVTRTAIAGSTSYWVNIPPLASKRDADVKASELRNLRVAEFYIVQEPGPNNHAISLGLFSTHDSANTHLEMLRAQGVKSAKVTERIVKAPMAAFEIRGPETQAEALRLAIAETAPESRLDTCKVQAP